MTAKALTRAALQSRQVTGLPWGRSPAAFVMSMQFRFVVSMLPKMQVYKPKKTKIGES